MKVGKALVLALAAMIPLVAVCQEPALAEHWTVKVTGGEIRGLVKDGVASFKGVPFAAPPVGELRWKAPQPVKPWDGVREAIRFAPVPMMSEVFVKLTQATVSEDCLYLNVWTSAKSPHERRPVMVWIPGGAFAASMSSPPCNDGTGLAQKGVVVVSVAYRVGPFGFLATSELSAESGKGSGCYGIQDQIAALRWVKKNIARFGGDPSRVTIFGESAGGMSVNILAASPAAKGLFQRVISQSGGSMAPMKQAKKSAGMMMPSLQYAESQGKILLTGLGVADISAARALSAEAIQKSSDEALQKAELDLFWPVADGETIIGDPYTRYEHRRFYQRKRFNDTPILVGTNSDDGGVYPLPTTTPKSFEDTVRDDFAFAAGEILAAYPHSTDVESTRSGRDIARETLFAWPSWAWVTLQSEKGKGRAFLYYFDYGAPGPGNVPHGAEVQYVFGTLDAGIFTKDGGPGASPENVATSDLIMSYWVNFAASGNPNGPGLPHWPAFDSTTMNTMIFGKSPQVEPTPNIEKIKAFDIYYGRIREQRRN